MKRLHICQILICSVHAANVFDMKIGLMIVTLNIESAAKENALLLQKLTLRVK